MIGFPLFLALALRQVDAMHAAVVTGLLPLATAAIAALALRQRPSFGFWACAVLGSALVLAFAAWAGGGRLSWADGLLLLAILSAAGGLRGRRLRVRELTAEQVICWVLVLSLPLTAPLMLLSWPTQPASAAAWGGFAYVTLFSMWLGFFAWYRGLALGGTVRVSQVQLLQPFLALLFAVPILGERLEPLTLLFSLAVIATVFLGRKMPVRAPAADPRCPSTRDRHARVHAHAWQLARRAERLEPSVIREILKITEQPGIISLAGGLPSPESFPVQAMREACAARADRHARARRCSTPPAKATARCASGWRRSWARRACRCDAAQVLITTGSQQGLDLVGKVLIDAGSRVAVEAPTYLGALQAFAPYEPEFVAVDCDEQGPLPPALAAAAGARFLYLLPNFQNPSGRSMGAARRVRVARRGACRPAAGRGQPLRRPVVRRAAAAAADRHGGRGQHLPGLLLQGAGAGAAPGLPGGAAGAVSRSCCRPSRRPTCTRPASTSAWRTRSSATASSTPTCRRCARATRRSATPCAPRSTSTCRRAAASTCRPAACSSGSSCPSGLDAMALLPQAVDAGMAYVPGAPFYCHAPRPNTLRLSFVTVAPPLIEQGVAALGRVLSTALEARP